MTRSVRALALAMSIVAIALPQPSFGENLLRQTETSAVDFTKYLPRLEEVPWLNAGASPQRRSHVRPPEAGTVSALLFTPRTARAWPDSYTHSAVADSGSVGM